MQVDDLAAAMRWISCNMGLIGFDAVPEVFLMGHSSGAHIALLYLIRRAKKDTREDQRAAREGSDGVGVGEGGELGQVEVEVEVEGFIGLSGVYDVHRHYLYESWRRGLYFVFSASFLSASMLLHSRLVLNHEQEKVRITILRSSCYL